MSKGIDRNCAVDETGGQIAVFGRLRSRPFNRRDMERLFLTPGGSLYRVRDRVETMANWRGPLVPPRRSFGTIAVSFASGLLTT